MYLLELLLKMMSGQKNLPKKLNDDESVNVDDLKDHQAHKDDFGVYVIHDVLRQQCGMDLCDAIEVANYCDCSNRGPWLENDEMLHDEKMHMMKHHDDGNKKMEVHDYVQ